MNESTQQPISNSQRIQQGLDLAYKNMLAFKRYKQTPIVIMRDRQVVEVSPNELPPVKPAA